MYSVQLAPNEPDKTLLVMDSRTDVSVRLRDGTIELCQDSLCRPLMEAKASILNLSVNNSTLEVCLADNCITNDLTSGLALETGHSSGRFLVCHGTCTTCDGSVDAGNYSDCTVCPAKSTDLTGNSYNICTPLCYAGNTETVTNVCDAVSIDEVLKLNDFGNTWSTTNFALTGVNTLPVYHRG
jgi:hypothetical protein